MDLRFCALTNAAYLIGIVKTLRRMYTPIFNAPVAMVTALDDIELHEQRVLTRIAATSQAREMRQAMIGRDAAHG